MAKATNPYEFRCQALNPENLNLPPSEVGRREVYKSLTRLLR